MKFALRNSWLVILFLLAQSASAQQPEANIWYFGRFLGLDFNSGTAVPLNDGRTNTIEGVATISDNTGRLLFYTDGLTVWNRLHQVMPNGTGLAGNESSTQSAVIVPFINDPTRYYIFTVEQLGRPVGLTYSIVNMTLAGGNGNVESKNIPLQSNVVEKVTAVRHCNNRDVWVVAHGSGSDIYYSFLVNGAGVSTTPIISHSGVVLPVKDSATLGYMKVSPDGSKIAAAHFSEGAEVSDFNNGNGVVSNSKSLFLPTERYYIPYGIEFSPDSKLLYTTVFYNDPANGVARNALLQYDATLGSTPAIAATKQEISRNSDPIQTYAALQVAPDGKMYMAKNTYPNIAAVNSPNISGTGCGYVANAIQFTLPNQKSSFGLPTFIQSYFYPVDSFSYQRACPGATFNFTYNPSPRILSVEWRFNDPPSGPNNTSTLINPTHLFTAPGTYTVELIRFTNCGPDTLRRQIVADTLNLNLGPDISLCGTGSIVLNPGAVGNTNTYLWQDGSTNSTYTASSAGLYWLEVKNNMGCTKRDSIQVNFNSLPVFNLGPDQAICQQDTLVLNATIANAVSYTWNTGATSPTIKAFQPGMYWCEVNNGCIYRDTLIITGDKPIPSVNLGNDQTVCEDISVLLNASFPGATYLWQDGSTSPTYNVTTQGKYKVTLDLNGCKAVDSVRINHILKPIFSLGENQFICPGNTIVLNPVLDQSWQLLWQDGSSGNTYTVTQPGLYSLKATNNCGSLLDEINIDKGTCRVYVPSAFTPNKDGLNDEFKILGTETVIKFNLKIFNRWGEVVFESADKNKGWNGTAQGKPLDSGVFIYMLSFTDMNATSPSFMKGTLTLVR